jgi:hypothetical protein
LEVVVKQMGIKQVKALEEANKDLTVKINSNIKTCNNVAANVSELLNKFTVLEKTVKVLEK